MAAERFQKLSIDTQADSRRRPAPFPAADDSRHGSRNAAFVLSGRSNGSIVTDSALEEAIIESGEDRDGSNSPNTSSSSNDLATLRHALRERGTSISFHPEVKLDDGDCRRLDEPLPKGNTAAHPVETPSQNIPIRQRARGHSDAGMEAYDAITGAPIQPRARAPQRYHPGEMRYPLVQATVDDLARDPQHLQIADQVPSLTSEISASPMSENLGTPINERLLSPLTTTSPIGISSQPSVSPLVGRRSVSQRSFGSMGSVGRRRNIKSATSSLSSPARSFLAQWTQGENVREPDPDDEGQQISGSEYIIGRKIGYGGFSVVREVTTMENDRKVVRAVKIVRKQVQDRSDQENEELQNGLEREVGVWRYLRHQYILPLISVYSTPFATFCITKLNTGGTLFDLIRARRKNKEVPNGLPAHLAKRYIYQLGSAIRFLHEDLRVVHRDIKPENCLLDMSAPDAETVGGNILLCDFGMADFIHNESSHAPEDHNKNIGPAQTSTSIQGSLAYIAPELLTTTHTIDSTEADMWAYGCTLYTLLTGDLPFQHQFQPLLIMMISKGDYDMTALEECPAAQECGESVIDLVKGCLSLQHHERWTISQALDCDFLQGCRALYEESDFS
jgi:hypothetical protein